MIVGTAGHIDHGKTTLVRALTGVDTDRLPQEKERGISIELGFAFLDAPGGERIGFIDVPGHERLVHTMLAGATGIDLALLLVAADDGVMPQTREHLAVIALLGIARGAVVVTKTDRVDAARVAAVACEARELVAATALASAPLFEVAATTGAGIAGLRDWLFAAAADVAAPPDDGRAFRLAIDRAFTLSGVGTVVTGTVHAGRIGLGDELALLPGDASRRMRVRSLHAQNRPVETARAGQRCAVALAGIAKDEIARGQWLADPAVALQTDRLDARLALWPAEPRALRSGTPVHVHVGAGEVLGTIAVLDARADTIAPGECAFAQIVLRKPIGAWRGDRVVLRDASAARTIGGGPVLDPLAPSRYRRTPERLAEIEAETLPTGSERLAARLAAARHGLDLRRWCAAEGLAPVRRPPLPSDALAIEAADEAWALDARHADTLGERAVAALAAFHAQQPDQMGPDAARLRRLAAPRLPPALWRALLHRLAEQGRLAQRGAFVHLPAHGVTLSVAENRIAQKVAPLLAADAFAGSWVRDLARDAGEGEAAMRGALARLAQRGELHQVVKDLYYAPEAMARLAAVARELASANGAVEAAAFRDATGLGRKRAIQILEHLDRVGLLRRVGDAHRLRPDSELFRAEPRPGSG